MKINCLSCGHKVELDEAYDDFEGQIKCLVCGAMLEIKADQGMLKKIKVAAPVSAGPRPKSRSLAGLAAG
jgi:DNA-directed RNA polymerase subunit RPC12/RpoP